MVIVNPWITLLSFVYFIVAGFGAFIFSRFIVEKYLELMRSVVLDLEWIGGRRDPPEVAQETPIFGPTHHLTNTRVKISLMATLRMRRNKKV